MMHQDLDIQPTKKNTSYLVTEMSCIIENRQLPQVKNTEAQLSIKVIRFCSDIIKVNVLSLYY